MLTTKRGVPAPEFSSRMCAPVSGCGGDRCRFGCCFSFRGEIFTRLERFMRSSAEMTGSSFPARRDPRDDGGSGVDSLVPLVLVS